MTYSYTTINSATPTTELVTDVEDVLTAHPAWVYVQEVVEGGFTTRVWRNLGTSNLFGTDFYVALMRTSTTSDLTIKVAEDWNGTLAFRGANQWSINWTPEATYRSRLGASGFAWSSTNWLPSPVSVSISANFNAAILASNDGLYVNTLRGTIGQGIYSGLFEIEDPYKILPLEFPLCSITSHSSSQGTFTRVPQEHSTTTDVCDAYGWGTNQVFSPTGTSAPMVFETPMNGSLASSLETTILNDDVLGSRMLAVHLANHQSNGGKIRGRLPNLVAFNLASALVSLRDTVEVDGLLYICVSNGGTIGVFMNTEASGTPDLGSHRVTNTLSIPVRKDRVWLDGSWRTL